LDGRARASGFGAFAFRPSLDYRRQPPPAAASRRQPLQARREVTGREQVHVPTVRGPQREQLGPSAVDNGGAMDRRLA